MELIHEIVWGPAMLFLFLFTGALYMVRLRGFPLLGFFQWWRATAGSLRRAGENRNGGISQFQSACTALAATIGTGNITGVATALLAGGPGAVFWMWVSAFLGMATAYGETELGIRYRRPAKNGGWASGPMLYLEQGMKCPALGILYAFFCMAASFGMGSMVQANAISESLGFAFDLPAGFIGLVLAVLSGRILFGGIGKIAGVAARLVPVSALLYMAAALGVLFVYRENLVSSFVLILTDAFSFHSAAGGALGYGISRAVRYGIARGVFSNEAGLGSSVIVHSASNVKSPVIQGFWGIQEVFLDTIVMCTLTALVILTSGVYDGTKEIDGMMLTTKAFAVVFGSRGGRFISVAVVIFGFATLIGWSYYGVKCVEYLFGKKWTVLYQGIYCGVTVIGCTMELTTVWNFADNMNGLLAIPNLIAILLLSKYVFAEINNFERREKRKG